MAQLSDDCFAFSGPLMPVDDVERLVLERVAPVAETEHIDLAHAEGRVVANDVSTVLVTGSCGESVSPDPTSQTFTADPAVSPGRPMPCTSPVTGSKLQARLSVKMSSISVGWLYGMALCGLLVDSESIS